MVSDDTEHTCIVAQSWLGFGPRRSGVFSAGNGPAMRCAVIGAAVPDLAAMRRLVEINTRITHTDPKALHGALAVALAARMPRTSPEEYLRDLRSLLGDDAAEFLQLSERGRTERIS